MKFKVCILAAGKGTRNSYSDNYHKSLIPLNGKSILSNIMECYPKNTKFVIAVGYKSELIKKYLKITHPRKKIKFVKVDNYDGLGSGPGYSLLKCKKYLQTPFISHACDALINNKIQGLTHNWLGYDKIKKKQISKFVSFEFEKDGKVNFKRINNKGNIFVGVAGVYDYKNFWKNLKQENFFSLKLSKKNNYEKQMLDGFKGLNNIRTKKLKWFDTGDDFTYEESILKMSKGNNLVMPKKNEFIYFENNKVIKYFKDSKIAEYRFKRKKYLNKFMPNNIKIVNNFLYYDFYKGKTLTYFKKRNVFEFFMNKMIKDFWKEKKLNKYLRNNFEKECYEFYKTKTYSRVNKFIHMYPKSKKIKFVNNYKIRDIKELLKKLNWDMLKKGKPTIAHGDTAPNNVIFAKNKMEFKLIDWREKFNNLIKYGDIYYDLAKIYHALEISQLLEVSKSYHVLEKNNKVAIRYKLYKNLKSFKNTFEKIIMKTNLDFNKIYLLSNIIFLNIAPLHPGNFGKLFFWKGIYNLNKFLDEK